MTTAWQQQPPSYTSEPVIPSGAYLDADGKVCTLQMTSHRRFNAPIEYTITTYRQEPISQGGPAHSSCASPMALAMPSPLRERGSGYGANPPRGRIQDAAKAALAVSAPPPLVQEHGPASMFSDRLSYETPEAALPLRKTPGGALQHAKDRGGAQQHDQEEHDQDQHDDLHHHHHHHHRQAIRIPAPQPEAFDRPAATGGARAASPQLKHSSPPPCRPAVRPPALPVSKDLRSVAASPSGASPSGHSCGSAASTTSAHSPPAHRTSVMPSNRHAAAKAMSAAVAAAARAKGSRDVSTSKRAATTLSHGQSRDGPAAKRPRRILQDDEGDEARTAQQDDASSAAMQDDGSTVLQAAADLQDLSHQAWTSVA